MHVLELNMSCTRGVLDLGGVTKVYRGFTPGVEQVSIRWHPHHTSPYTPAPHLAGHPHLQYTTFFIHLLYNFYYYSFTTPEYKWYLQDHIEGQSPCSRGSLHSLSPSKQLGEPGKVMGLPLLSNIDLQWTVPCCHAVGEDSSFSI